MMKLHGYWRSSASYRVRIALNLKNIQVEHVSVNLKNGDQFSELHSTLNTQALVPILELPSGERLTQSTTILEYLDEAYPEAKLLPENPLEKAKARAFAQIIAADIAPIQNLRVLKHIKKTFGAGSDEVQNWAQHWIALGFESLETQIFSRGCESDFLFGDGPGFAECFLIPQIYNAKRFGVDMSIFPNLNQIDTLCQVHPVFIKAKPEAQSDAVLD